MTQTRASLRAKEMLARMLNGTAQWKLGLSRAPQGVLSSNHMVQRIGKACWGTGPWGAAENTGLGRLVWYRWRGRTVPAGSTARNTARLIPLFLWKLGHNVVMGSDTSPLHSASPSPKKEVRVIEVQSMFTGERAGVQISRES